MTALRWTLGIILTLAGGGFMLLSVIAGNFRKSFGASDVNPLITILPVVGMALLLAALIFPAKRVLVHTAAAAAIGMIVLCVWQLISEAATFLWISLLYLVAWLVFYWHAAWSTPVPGVK
jgi:hypothetical protein